MCTKVIKRFHTRHNVLIPSHTLSNLGFRQKIIENNIFFITVLFPFKLVQHTFVKIDQKVYKGK